MDPAGDLDSVDLLVFPGKVGRSQRVANRSRSAIPPITPNTLFHPNRSPINAPSGTPKMRAAKYDEKIDPIAHPRFSYGKKSAAYEMVLRLSMLAPIPVEILPARRIGKLSARNEISDPNAKTIKPHRRPFLRPNASESGPQIRTDRPAQNEYPANKKPISVEDFPN